MPFWSRFLKSLGPWPQWVNADGHPGYEVTRVGGVTCLCQGAWSSGKARVGWAHG